MTTTVDNEIALERAKQWRDKAMEKERKRYTDTLKKIQAQYEARLMRIAKKVAK